MFGKRAHAGRPSTLAETDFPRLASGHLHEIHADAAAFATAMVFAFATLERDSREPILLARAPRRVAMRRQLCGEGLAGLGIDPARLLIVEARDDPALLQAGLDAARCSGLAAVVLETWGSLPRYDLTASRRLVLAAEQSGTPVIILRGDAAPRTSAAHNRWIIRSAPSAPMAANAPGLPACEAELSRRRGGPSGMRWRLEWNEGNGGFHAERIDAAPLSGAVVSLAALRADAQDHAAAVHALHPSGAGGTDPQRAAADGGGHPGQPTGPGRGDDPGRCAGALPEPDELAA